MDIFKANEPQLIAFYGFLNEDGTEMTNIQIYPDAASMDFHLQVLRENTSDAMGKASEFIKPKHIEYYGTPNATALEMDRQFVEVLSVKPLHIAGFTPRLAEPTPFSISKSTAHRLIMVAQGRISVRDCDGAPGFSSICALEPDEAIKDQPPGNFLLVRPA